ncbi:MAG TPA: LysM peptidoglycan-binding domain-containing protein [Verrucomicrobiae bacterium]|nr:LysM peptidoglycan-binding domain-containing protein [Verrucomicrobiae bacterium]
MKKISLWLFMFVMAVSLARAQDAATQQLIDQINGRIDNLMDMQTAQGKKIADLQKQISDLQDKLNQPAPNNYATLDDLKKLADQVAKTQQENNDLVLKELEKLQKAGGISTASHKPPDVSTPAVSGPQKGYYYEIKKDDTLIAIARAYSAELKTKVTVEQILAANPGLDPKNMAVGKRVFIPDPNAK